jgi:hypothetical protein
MRLSSYFVRLAVLGVLLAGVALAPVVQAEPIKAWGLHRAYNDLRVVHRDLKTFKKGSFGGHRVKALIHIDLAMDHLRAAAKHHYMGSVPKGVLAGKLPPPPARPSFAKLFADMQKAHRALKEIKPGNYGGHRAKAVVELDKAIVEMKKAL